MLPHTDSQLAGRTGGVCQSRTPAHVPAVGGGCSHALHDCCCDTVCRVAAQLMRVRGLYSAACSPAELARRDSRQGQLGYPLAGSCGIRMGCISWWPRASQSACTAFFTKEVWQTTSALQCSAPAGVHTCDCVPLPPVGYPCAVYAPVAASWVWSDPCVCSVGWPSAVAAKLCRAEGCSPQAECMPLRSSDPELLSSCAGCADVVPGACETGEM